MLTAFAGQVKEWLADNGFELLQQGTELDRTELLKRFKKDQRSCLIRDGQLLAGGGRGGRGVVERDNRAAAVRGA